MCLSVTLMASSVNQGITGLAGQPLNLPGRHVYTVRQSAVTSPGKQTPQSHCTHTPCPQKHSAFYQCHSKTIIRALSAIGRVNEWYQIHPQHHLPSQGPLLPTSGAAGLAREDASTHAPEQSAGQHKVIG